MTKGIPIFAEKEDNHGNRNKHKWLQVGRCVLDFAETIETGSAPIVGKEAGWIVKEQELPTKEVSMSEAEHFIQTLSVHGGMKVPADEKGIDALLKEKYWPMKVYVDTNSSQLYPFIQ